MPPRICGLTRKPVPHLPDWKASVGLIKTMLAEPRSSSLLHQLPCQSKGMKASSCATVAGSAAERNVDVAVAQGQRSALLLDRPIESGQRRGGDDRAELDHTGEEVQPLEAVKVVGRVDGDDVDAAPGGVDDGGP